MKNLHQEQRRRHMRQYHLCHPWPLSAGGLFIPHEYLPRELSWWADVGFILNRRRVMVWWIHPRQQYVDAIRDAAWAEAGEPPHDQDDFFSRPDPIHKRRGKSRKNVVAYQLAPTSATTRDYYDRINAIEARLTADGIDFFVRPSISIIAYDWCLGVSLCLPIEVSMVEDVRNLAGLVRQILIGNRSLPDAGYEYGREQWLAEADARQRDRVRLATQADMADAGMQHFMDEALADIDGWTE